MEEQKTGYFYSLMKLYIFQREPQSAARDIPSYITVAINNR